MREYNYDAIVRYCLYSLIFSFFLVPAGYVSNGFILFLLLFCVLLYDLHKVFFDAFDLLLIFLLFCVSYNDYFLLGNVFYLTVVVVLSKYRYSFKKDKAITVLMLLSVLSMVLQLAFIEKYDDVGGYVIKRMSLGIGDVNFSGAIILGYFLLANKLKYRFGIYFAIIAAVFLESRNFLFAIIVFYVVSFVKRNVKKIDLLKSPAYLIVFGNIFVFVLSYYWVENVRPEIVYGIGANRFVLNDSSNFARFLANVLSLDLIFSDVRYFLWGVPNFVEYVEFNSDMYLPHNSLLFFFMTSGFVYSLIYIILYLRCLVRVSDVTNYEYIAAFMFFSFFLHSMLTGVFMFMFFLIFLIQSEPHRSRGTAPENDVAGG